MSKKYRGDEPCGMSEDREQTDYEKAVDEIVAGALKFKALTDGDPDDQHYPDEESMGCVSDGAFCLRLAHRLWFELWANRKEEEEVARMRASPESLMLANAHAILTELGRHRPPADQASKPTEPGPAESDKSE